MKNDRHIRHHRALSIVILFVVSLLWLFWFFKYDHHDASLQRRLIPNNFWGVTFSKKYAEELGLNWRQAYLAMLDELKVQKVRVPVYWDDIEKQRDTFEFSDYDWMLDEAQQRNVQIVLAVGRRLPRWPECHQPQWVMQLARDDADQRHILATLTAIRHFKSWKAITHWQIENEYFFPWFGECPKADPDLIKKEIALLRSEDPRPIILTDSGELNSWRDAAKYSDVLGVTMYRVSWNNYFGYFRYAWPAWLYRLKAVIAGKNPSDTIIAELQAEPWPAHFKKVTQITSAEQNDSFSLKQFETNCEIARRTGFASAYLWGVEWWYWLKLHGDASMWQWAGQLFNDNENK